MPLIVPRPDYLEIKKNEKSVTQDYVVFKQTVSVAIDP